MTPVAFDVSPEVACAYLADPANRPEWQSSLARVEDVSGRVGVGQTWVDVTRPGVRPRMATTELDPGRRWTERGTWRGFSATLTLRFEPTPTGCDVHPEVSLRARGPAAPLAAVLARLAPLAVRADLRNAAKVLGGGHRRPTNPRSTGDS